MQPITIAHISDLHYNPGDSSAVANMLAEKQVLVERLLPLCLETLQQRKPDILLISGDLTHESTADAYQYLRTEFSKILTDTPILCTMGNHDIRGAFRQGFLDEPASDKPYYASCMVNGYQFISVDSSFEHPLTGFLTDDALDYLETQLSANQSSPTIVLMHLDMLHLHH